MQPQQLQIAGGAIHAVASAAGIHPDCHVVIAEFAGNVHGENRLAGIKVQHDELPHSGGHVLHIAIDIAGGGGELHDGGIPQVIAAPNGLHFIAVFRFDGVHSLHAGNNHLVALGHPVHVIDIGVALDGGITVSRRQLGAACAEPVAHNGADGAGTVVINNGGVFHRHRQVFRQIINHRCHGDHFAGFDVQCHQIHRGLIVGEDDQLLAQRGRAAAAPCQTGSGDFRTFGTCLSAVALIRRAPDDLHPAIGTEQIAVQIGENHRSLGMGGNAVFCALAGKQVIHIHRFAQIRGLSLEDCLDGIGGNVAEGALLPPVGIDAEAAGGKPEVALIVKHHRQQLLIQGLAQRRLGGSLDVDVQQLPELRQHIAVLVCGFQNQQMVMAGGADNPVFLAHKGVGRLNHIAAAVMLGRGEKSQGLGFIGIDVPDGNAAQHGNHGVTVAVIENGGRGIGIGGLEGNVDFRVDAQGQNFIGGIGVVTVLMDTGFTGCHIGILGHRLGCQGLEGQRRSAGRQQQRRQQAGNGAQGLSFHRVIPPRFVFSSQASRPCRSFSWLMGSIQK